MLFGTMIELTISVLIFIRIVTNVITIIILHDNTANYTVRISIQIIKIKL